MEKTREKRKREIPTKKARMERRKAKDNNRTLEAEEEGGGERKRNCWMAKSRAKAATVCSPPLSASMSRNRLAGGMA